MGAPTNVPGQAATVDTGKFIKKKGWQYYYQHRKLITIDKNMVEGTHTDFPVLINITLDDTKVQHAGGYDIIFNNTYGEQPDQEIESCSSDTGELIASDHFLPQRRLSTERHLWSLWAQLCWR